MDFSFPFVFEILLFLPPTRILFTPLRFLPLSSVLLFYFWRAGGLVSICWSFPFSTHPPYSKPPPIFPAVLSLAFWIFRIPRGNDVRRKGEWTEGTRRKGKSNVSRMGEGMKVTYWGVDQSGCMLRLDVRYCQKEAIFTPQNISVSLFASKIAALINRGRHEMSCGGGNFPFNAGMLDQSLTNSVFHGEQWNNFLDAQTITSLMSESCKSLQLNAAE